MSKLENRSMKDQKPLLSATGEFADFKVIHENWDLHELNNNSLLRSRVILSGVLQDKEKIDKLIEQMKGEKKPVLAMAFRTRQHFEVEAPPSSRGLPDSKTYSIDELKSCIVDEDIDFKTTQQSWNIYELESGIRIKLRLSVTALSRTNKFDGFGMPIYIIDSNIEGKTELPKSLKTIAKDKNLKIGVTRIK
jgi:hypothetical protein